LVITQVELLLIPVDQSSSRNVGKPLPPIKAQHKCFKKTRFTVPVLCPYENDIFVPGWSWKFVCRINVGLPVAQVNLFDIHCSYSSSSSNKSSKVCQSPRFLCLPSW